MLRVKEKGELRRFSLYLSAQLMYGLACVFSRQSSYLIDDVRSCLEKLHRAATVARIDMEETERLRLTLPDQLAIMEETLGAADPWFGVMTFQSPASETLHPIEFQADVLSPLPPSGSPLSPEPPFTMRDVMSLVPEAGMFAEQADLPELSPQEIQHLLSPHLLSPLAPHEAVVEEDEEDLRKDVTFEDSGVTQHPSRISLETDVDVTKRRTVEDILAASLVASPDALQVTLPGAVAPAMPSPPSPLHRADDSMDSPFHLAPLSPQGVARPPYRRRRRRLFIDDVIQMPQDEMRAQVDRPQRALQPFVPIEPESIHRNSVSYLFRNPASGWLMAPLRELWDRAAAPPVSARRRPHAPTASPSSVLSETEVVRAQVERSTLLGVTGEGIESVDGESITSAEIDKFPRALVHDVVMEAAVPEEVDMMEASVEEASPAVARFPAVPSRSPTPPARVRSPLQAAEAAAAAMRNQLLQRIEELTREMDDTLMSLLIPHDRTTRGMAARVFNMCLELAGHRIIALEQTQPFGAIRITRGPNFTSVR
uniref:Meiotic recombination protein REC8 homolog n=1 Tax=Petromyzon marinus TaxID=7757 RepID=A0AAJ7UEH3_PETMA|nr:meiotic recombination protein REC8 homolog [Petromyzon marinus]